MRNVVIQDEFSERDIRPGIEITEYLSLVEKDVKKYFKDNLIDIDCPGCLSMQYESAFERFGFEYVECKECGTVFMNPRPPQEVVDVYYRESNAAKFWLQQFLKASELSRKDHIYVPRVNWILGAVRDYKVSVERYLDVFSKYESMLKLLKKELDFNEGFLFCPLISEKNLEDYDILENVEKHKGLDVNVVTAFEIIERVSQPNAFIKMVKDTLAFNALFFLTTSTIDGFEHQVLWENSRNIFPPDHMTLFSIKGLKLMLEHNSLSVLELSTPGVLDLEIVISRLKEVAGVKVPRFLGKIINGENQELKTDFQTFLQRNRLSSHVRIACRLNTTKYENESRVKG